MVKFSTRLLAGFIHGLMMAITMFFTGALLESAWHTLATLPYPTGTIPTILGAFGFVSSIAYEVSRRKDDEEKPASS